MLTERPDCRCGHPYDKHAPDKWDVLCCAECKCDVYEDPDSATYCFCQKTRNPDGSRRKCY